VSPCSNAARRQNYRQIDWVDSDRQSCWQGLIPGCDECRQRSEPDLAVRPPENRDTQDTGRTNAVPPKTIDDNDTNIRSTRKRSHGLVKDLGYVRDGLGGAENVRRADGRRSVLLSVIKNGNDLDVDVVNGSRRA